MASYFNHEDIRPVYSYIWKITHITPAVIVLENQNILDFVMAYQSPYISLCNLHPYYNSPKAT